MNAPGRARREADTPAASPVDEASRGPSTHSGLSHPSLFLAFLADLYCDVCHTPMRGRRCPHGDAHRDCCEDDIDSRENYRLEYLGDVDADGECLG